MLRTRRSGKRVAAATLAMVTGTGTNMARAIATSLTATAVMAIELSSRMRQQARALAIWLVLSLLVVQCAGLIHRVLHAGLEGPGPQSTVFKAPAAAAPGHWPGGAARPATRSDPATADAGLLHAGHSCVLFDAAATADAHCDLLTALELSQERPILPLALDWRWPHLPPARPFLTRAPPAGAGLTA